MAAHSPAAVSEPAVHAAAAAAHRATVSACDLVTRADVVQALGFAVEQGRGHDEAFASTCDYAARHGQISVTFQRLGKTLDVEAAMAALQASIPDSSVRKARGLGARAFFLDIAGAGTQLYVIRDGSEYLMVSVLGLGEAAQVAPVAEAIARRALGRL
jgi:hypothetical protein